MFGFNRVHEYVLKLVDYETCPQMDENCPEADKLDITKCLSCKLNFFENIDSILIYSSQILNLYKR